LVTDEIISISGGRGGLSAEINALGAELWTLRDADGRDLLWHGDAAYWTGRAPILFPIVGALNGGTYRIGDATYALPQHGFGRRRQFELIHADRSRASFRLVSDAETRAVYPFEFALTITFTISGARLDVTADLVNRGDGPLAASFGYHPAFLWPLPSRAARDEHAILFDAAETARVFRPDARGLLDPCSQHSPADGRELRLDDGLFADGALIFTELAGRSATYGAELGPRLRIDYPDSPHLGIWSKPGAPFVCIEPWQGYADPAGFDGEIWEKPGIVRLDASAQRSWRMGVAIISDTD
jgi:galactose mutarotase-like enzyme